VVQTMLYGSDNVFSRISIGSPFMYTKVPTTVKDFRLNDLKY
jgi:hypothetical protein